jgi:hypothetical protein
MSSEAGRDHNEKGEDSRVRAIWPKLQGELVIDVEGIIKQDRPDLTIQRVPEGSMVTMDHRMVISICMYIHMNKMMCNTSISAAIQRAFTYMKIHRQI